jgi:hypothetical protein
MHGDEIDWLPAQTPPSTYNGTITTQCDAADYAVTARDDAAVEALAAAKKVIIKLPNGLVSLELRFRYNGTAADQHVLQLFAASGVDFYNLVATLTIDQGTQQHTAGVAGTGIFFCDTVVPSNEKWLTPQTELTDTSNHIGGYTMNMRLHNEYARLRQVVARCLDPRYGKFRDDPVYRLEAVIRSKLWHLQR